MATGEKWTAQAVATTFDSGDIMSIVQSGVNKQVDHDILMGDTQICKAWVNFNGTGTVAIRDDFNVSSITDSATGSYIVNLTNALTDVNGSAMGWGQRNTGETALQASGKITGTSTITLVFGNEANSLFDADTLFMQIFGS